MSGALLQHGHDALPSLLVVDDDLTFCEVLAAALRKRGFSVSAAHDVADAFRAAERDLPEYVVLDLKMPGWSAACPRTQPQARCLTSSGRWDN